MEVEYTDLGSSDLWASKVRLGTWQFGAAEWGFGADLDERDALATVAAALPRSRGGWDG